MHKKSLIVTIVLSLLLSPTGLYALVSPSKNIRTANYFLKAGTQLTPEVARQLAEYDLVILPAEAQIYDRDEIILMRRLNPEIAILAYVPSKSISLGWFDDLHRIVKREALDEWRLRDGEGRPLSVWPGTKAYNIAGPWHAYLPVFVHSHIMSTGLWDGIFYDEVSATISWLNGGNLDLNGDRVRDTKEEADRAWRSGMTDLLRISRSLEGPEAIIITNGDSETAFSPYVNGRMFETFPTPWERGGSWQNVMQSYLRLNSEVRTPAVFVVNGNTGNTGTPDPRRVRFTSASTLLGDGFWGFDFGDQDHGQLWSFDEARASIGRPEGRPRNVKAPQKNTIVASVWRRDYEQGLVVVNSATTPETVDLGGDFEKLRGTVDPWVNDGSIVNEVDLAPEDGLILLRPLGKIFDARYRNGSFVRVYDSSGTSTRQGFFVRDRRIGAQSLITERDLGTDGRREKLIATGNTLQLRDASGGIIWSIRPYGTTATAIEFALGDLDGDGKLEIVTAPNRGEPRVRVYDTFGRPKGSGFLAFGKTQKSGVSVALGDTNGDGRDEIIVGAGSGGSPLVRIFSGTGAVVNQGFLAYDPRFRGGVRVASGDLDNDGTAEIVTGAGRGGGPFVRVFGKDGKTKLTRGFFAFTPKDRNGIEVGVADVDQDGTMEIIAFGSP